MRTIENVPMIWDCTLMFVLGVLPVALAIWYFLIISRRNTVLEALSSIDVQLKQRFDLIPNLLKMAARFMTHERALMTEITELRTKAASGYDPSDADAVRDHLAAVEQLSGKMNQLMVQVENYPQLKSDQTVNQAMMTYAEVEAKISASRRFFNSAVTSLNNVVQSFPGTLIAKFAGVKTMPYFKGEEVIHQPIDVDALMAVRSS